MNVIDVKIFVLKKYSALCLKRKRGEGNMDLEKLYDAQKDLDKHILKNNNNEDMLKEELLNNTILALLVEIGEFANTTRCFKHWSKKGMMEDEVVLDELADVLHFYLSIGNQIGIKILTWDCLPSHGYDDVGEIVNKLTSIYYWTTELINSLKSDDSERSNFAYIQLGNSIQYVSGLLGFKEQEIEDAYYKKHEENYYRQRSGY